MSVHNIREEVIHPGDVYVGRRMAALSEAIPGGNGYFGNRFRVEQHGRAGAIAKFEEYARARMTCEPYYRERVKSLHGKRLFCWCAPLPCHAEVLERLAAELQEDR